MTIEDRIAELCATPTVDWHFAFMLRYGLDGGKNRPESVIGFMRSHVLRYIGAALIEGYDGGEIAPKPRNAHEHRRGEVWIGSTLLHHLDRFDGIDWWRVGELLEPLVVGRDETPPLRRPDAPPLRRKAA